ncbi:hypothetical protein FNH05_20820 [Amycolatopsis rhizosphaerae]|uniref:Wadjet protein JetD C-terminal domain-containing protein n=1 Tax=Amycolatopsis rhizosphaerae TaxID=2053003 RepID=A0A558C8H2_9PSEU|nr:DUF2220 domain-containing protein [Amycolatopsis rhizosphaerae]TVT45091.1 hypothetical protein FNH05_20820 [Amycolatopsis rhizosphaerae]
MDTTRPSSDLAGRYRFRSKPAYVRFRHLQQHGTRFTELAVQVSELADMPLEARTVFVVENEITYLAFPPVEDAVVLFGGGYAVARLAPLWWLADKNLVYWGRYRHPRLRHPQPAAPLLRPYPFTADGPSDAPGTRKSVGARSELTNEHLEMLLPHEAALYTDLVEDPLGPAIRPEQDRVSYGAIEKTIRAPLPPAD